MRKKTVFSALMLLLVMSNTAFAADTPLIKTDLKNDETTIIVNNLKDSKYSFSVLKGKKSIADFKTEGNIADECVWVSEEVPEEKTLMLKFKINEGGKYTYYIVGEDEVITGELDLLSNAEMRDAIKALNDWHEGDGITFLQLIKNNSDKLKIDTMLFNTSIEQETADAIYEKLPLDVENAEKSIDKIDACVRVCAIMNGNKAAAKKNIFNLLNDVAAKWGTGDVVSADMLDNIIEKCKDKKTRDEFYDSLEKELVLEILCKPSGVTNFRNILKDYPEIGINESNYTDAQCYKVIGNRYSSFSDFKKALENTKNSGGTGGGNSSGGSSGRVSGPSTSGSLPYTPVSTNNDLKELVGFEDLEGYEWAYEQIISLATNNIVSGVGDNKFEPGKNIKREEFIKMIVSALNLTLDNYSDLFDDVEEDNWFAKYVVTAKNYNICQGVSERIFGSGRELSRQDMAVLLFNVLKDKEVVSKKERTVFEDDNEISDYAKQAVYFMQEKGIMNGKENNHFDPKAPAKRAEVAVVIYSLINLLK